MVAATCELVWIKQLLGELKFGTIDHMKLMCDTKFLKSNDQLANIFTKSSH